MKISTKGRYALRLMLDLSEHKDEGLSRIKAISARLDVSEKYLEQIINPLTKAGFVKSTRGAQGGYVIAVDPKTTFVGSILRVMEGSLAPVRCVDSQECPKAEECKTARLWKRIGHAVDEVVDSVTLQDLLDGTV
jgi:Rrf2 family cysteine metabolism transcriptional repressor